MVRDLHVPVRLFFEKTVRELDGLALSSRNAYLSAEERAQAVVLQLALQEAQVAFRSGHTRSSVIRKRIEDRIASAPLARIDYIELVDGATLRPVKTLKKGCVLALAVFFGRTRLIDNLHF